LQLNRGVNYVVLAALLKQITLTRFTSKAVGDALMAKANGVGGPLFRMGRRKEGYGLIPIPCEKDIASSAFTSE
jgi:hypothetical protein